MQAYRIGRLTLHPRRELLDDGTTVAIGGRALDLLSVLAEADGAVVSKDQLLAKVWGGVIVEDNALQAQVSAARKALGSEAHRLVTMHRHGYRLELNGDEVADSPQIAAAATDLRVRSRHALVPVATSDDPARALATSPHRRWTRRAAAGAVAVGAAGAATGLALWRRSSRHVPDPRAVALYRRGQAMQKAGALDEATGGEAIAAYKQAVAIDPRYADAWGALALSYRYPDIAPSERLGDPQEVRAPARRALALDPNNADARLALILLYPWNRRWLEHEARLRAFLGEHPDSALGAVMLSGLLFDTGRLDDALAAARRAIEIDPALLTVWGMRVTELAYAGRIGEAEIVLGHARSRWPQDVQLWFSGSEILLESKQYAESVAYLRDATRRPAAVPAGVVERVIRQHEALATGQGMVELRNLIRTTRAAPMTENIGYSVSVAAGSGMTDEAFAFLEAFFLGGSVNGTRVPAPGPLDYRYTGVLFAPSVLSLRNDPRFASLLQRIGLEDYWRKSGTQPDFRQS